MGRKRGRSARFARGVDDEAVAVGLGQLRVVLRVIHQNDPRKSAYWCPRVDEAVCHEMVAQRGHNQWMKVGRGYRREDEGVRAVQLF